jgi:Fe-S cluster assembly protein SufD
MALMQQEQSFTLLSPREHVAEHTCRISDRAAQIEAGGMGDLFLETRALSKLDELELNIGAEHVQVFLPVSAAETTLEITVNLSPGANALLFLLSRGTARALQVTMNAYDHSQAKVFSLLDDTATRASFAVMVRAGGEVSLTGLTRTQGTTATAIEVSVRHLQGNSRTEQKFFSYARDTSQIRFTGRIVVDPGASGAEAHQLHRGLTLSAGARIDAQPFLNILHDDVRCTHGSTVGFIDEEALAYLMARGLGRSVAEQILIHSSERQFFDLVPAGAAREFFGFSEEPL